MLFGLGGSTVKHYIVLWVVLFTVLVFVLPNANAGSTLEEIREKGVLTVCMDVRNLPYSNADPELPGLNVEVAHLLAEELGVKLELHWLNTLRDSLLADMLRGHCDCVIGIPIEDRAMSESIQLGKSVDFSKPYYGTGYILVKRKNNQQSPKTLKDIKPRRLAQKQDPSQVISFDSRDIIAGSIVRKLPSSTLSRKGKSLTDVSGQTLAG